MRIATWNVEWFNALFDDEGRLQPDDRWSARHGVTRREQLSGLVEVFRALDPDAVLVVEAPDESRRRSTVRALEGFAADAGIRARRALIGFPNATEQEIALLHDPHAAGRRDRGRAAPATARFVIAPEDRWVSALLDFILVSPDLMSAGPRWRIWHPFDDRACWRDPVLRRALLHASDHFPVTLDLDR